MDTPKKQYGFGPLTLYMYRSDQAVEHKPRQLSTGTNAFVLLSYAALVTLMVLWLLFVLVPFYLSGYEQLSDEQIEWSNLWLWEFNEYPLFRLASAQFISQTVMMAVPCAGIPVFLCLLVELAYNWAALNWRINTLKVACLVLIVATIILYWQSLDKVFILVFD